MSKPKEEAYDDKIAPLMTDIIKICHDNNIAMFAHFRLDDKNANEDDEGVDVLACTTSLPVSELKDDNDRVEVLRREVYRGPEVFTAVVMTAEAP